MIGKRNIISVALRVLLVLNLVVLVGLAVASYKTNKEINQLKEQLSKRAVDTSYFLTSSNYNK